VDVIRPRRPPDGRPPTVPPFPRLDPGNSAVMRLCEGGDTNEPLDNARDLVIRPLSPLSVVCRGNGGRVGLGAIFHACRPRNSCARYVSTRRQRVWSRRRVHQLSGQRDLALDGDQVAVNVNAPPARVLVDLLKPTAPRPGRLAGELIGLSRPPTGAGPRPSIRAGAPRESLRARCRRRAVHSAMPVRGSPCSPSWSCERGAGGRQAPPKSKRRYGGHLRL
jgi:hypothetical protein